MRPAWNFNLNQTNEHHKESHFNSIFTHFELIIIFRFATVPQMCIIGMEVMHYNISLTPE